MGLIHDPHMSNLAERAAALGPWFHNLHLGSVETAPRHFLGITLKFDCFSDEIPADLAGKSSLDIGCNAGFYAIEMKKRRGARCRHRFGLPLPLPGRFALDHLGLEIELRQMTVWDVARLEDKVDLVVFMGIMYHLRHPLLALDLIHEHVARLAVVSKHAARQRSIGADCIGL